MSDHVPGVGLSLLSERERTIVDLAVDGRTDEQIAQRTGLSASTVSSSWARVRGKLGLLGRTEIVGAVLRDEAERRSEALEAENATLRARLALSEDARRRADAALSELGGAPWSLLALESLCDAAYVVRAPGIVDYANPEARRFLPAEVGRLEGRAAWSLVFGEDGRSLEPEVRAFFSNAGIHRATVGVRRPLYARLPNGAACRVTIDARRFDARDGAMAVVVVRAFLQDVEAIVRALRFPLP